MSNKQKTCDKCKWGKPYISCDRPMTLRKTLCDYWNHWTPKTTVRVNVWILQNVTTKEIVDIYDRRKQARIAKNVIVRYRGGSFRVIQKAVEV